MALEDLILARPHLEELGEEHVNALLDLMEDPSLPMTSSTWIALNRFLKGLEYEFGDDHPAVLQVRDALSLTLRTASSSGVFKNSGLRIS